MAVGRCRHCGKSPIAFDAEFCPRCMGKDPNPSPHHSHAKVGLLWGVLFFVALGVGWSFVVRGDSAGVVVGVMLGALLGCLFGPIAGWLIGMAIGKTPVSFVNDQDDFDSDR